MIKQVITTTKGELPVINLLHMFSNKKLKRLGQTRGRTLQMLFRENRHQLRRWAHQSEIGRTKREKLLKISEYVIPKLINAIEAGYILCDRDFRQ